MFKRNIFAVILLAFFVLGMTSCKRTDEEQARINELNAAGGDTSFTADSKEEINTEKTNLNKLPKLALSSNGKNIEQTVVALADQTEVSIAFSESNTHSDTYLDEAKNKYSFNTSNELVSYSASGMSTVSETILSEKQVDEIAREHIAKMYGDHILDGYVLDVCQDRGIDYNVQYIKKYGSSDMVNGELCIVFVNYDGKIKYSNVMSFGRFDDFDENLLDGITEETIQSFANQQTVAMYPNNSYSCLIESIWLHEGEGGYYLNISVTLTDSEDHILPAEYTYSLR